jgi:hypothetical protein
VLAAGAAAYALGAATTSAFTTAADVVTALPIVALAVLVVVRWPLRARPRPPRRPRRRPRSHEPVHDPAGDSGAAHPWRAWVVLLVVVVAWELAEYAARGSRADHPTLSSMLDAVDRTDGLKAVVFFLWLWLGAAIVRGGSGGGRDPEATRPGSS